MNKLKDIFVLVCTTITMLIIFAILDVVLMGLLSLVISIWNPSFATQMFKWSFLILFALEALFTIPVIIKSTKNGGEK